MNIMNSNEAEQIKRQLLNNINSKFPGENGEILRKQILSMSNEQLEQSLKKPTQNECIFCSIALGNVESYKIDETENAIAVLEINPISKGHSIIISKEHIPLETFPEDISEFAKNVAKNLKEKLNSKAVEISPLNFQGHGMINLIPIYTNEGIKSERYKAQDKELKEVLETLKEKPKEIKKIKIKKEKRVRAKKIDSKNIWLPKRIP
jgi:histidine triad (HIT) family protein